MRRTRWWHLAADDEDGLGLVEVMVAVFVLSVAVLAIASVATSSLISLRVARDREHATNAASAAVEAARARDFGALALAPTDDPASLPADIRALLDVSGSCAGGERIVQDGASVDPVPLQQAYDRSPQAVVYTVVTWATSPAPDCTVTRSDLKRVVTLATWRDQGNLRSVRNETFVAPAGRGLPVPNFDVKPVESSVSISPLQANETPPAERCVEHQLRNLGAMDRYEWEVTEVVGGAGSATFNGTDSWTLNTQWKVRAFFEAPAVDSRGGFPPSDESVGGPLMRDTDVNGRPESDVAVEPRETATITICYTPTSASVTPVEVTIDIVSRFDDRAREQVVHDVAVRDPNVYLYLQDRDDQIDHPRVADTGNVERRYPPYRMNPLNPASEDQQQMLGPTARLKWGNEIDGHANTPGLPLLRAVSGNQSDRLRTVDFRYGVPAAMTLLSDADLRLWTAPASSVRNADSSPKEVAIRIELDVLNAEETARVWPATAPITQGIAYVHNSSNFRQHDLTLSFPPVALQTNQRLRLRITCLGSSEDDCAIAYDTVNHPAFLRVGLQ